MTRHDQQILFTSLSFLAVILNDTPTAKRVDRTKVIARLMDAFCTTELQSIFGANTSIDAQDILSKYLNELRQTGSARLDFDWQTLLSMYELLLAEKNRREQEAFYSADEDLIANRVLQLAEEQIRSEEEA